MDQVRMRALRPWVDNDREGQVSVGNEFMADERHARELEARNLAERVVAHPRVRVTADPAWGIETRPLSLSPPAKAPPGKTSIKFVAGPTSSR
ncbi:MAG: hypothetical protein ABI369_02995 [Acetobacteraceae bacterium]